MKSVFLQKRRALKKPRAMIKTRLGTEGGGLFWARSRWRGYPEAIMRIEQVAEKACNRRHMQKPAMQPEWQSKSHRKKRPSTLKFTVGGRANDRVSQGRHPQVQSGKLLQEKG